MKKKQEEAIPYILSFPSNLPMYLSKLTTAYNHPGGLDGAQVAKKANAITVCVVVLLQPTAKPHTATPSLTHQWDREAIQKGKTCWERDPGKEKTKERKTRN